LVVRRARGGKGGAESRVGPSDPAIDMATDAVQRPHALGAMASAYHGVGVACTCVDTRASFSGHFQRHLRPRLKS